MRALALSTCALIVLASACAARARSDMALDARAHACAIDSTWVRGARDYAAFYATDDDSIAVDARRSWGLRRLRDADVVILVDSTACARGLLLHRQAYPVTEGYAERVAVIRMGQLRGVLRERTDHARTGHQPMLVADEALQRVVYVQW